MRQTIVAGNWKMNKTSDDAISLVKELKEEVSTTNKQVIVAPPYPFLSEVGSLIADRGDIALAAQNIHQEVNGAYTGEVSAAMLKSVGCEYVIVGHSERRAYFGEKEELLATKVNACLANGLTPIYCCGEQLEERQSNKFFEVVERQVKGGLFHLTATEVKDIVIAYEPVWAIGTGETATSDQAQEMHRFIRGVVGRKYGSEISDQIAILYGGSCKPSNAAELFACPDVDGGLIGGASLKAADFSQIISA